MRIPRPTYLLVALLALAGCPGSGDDSGRASPSPDQAASPETESPATPPPNPTTSPAEAAPGEPAPGEAAPGEPASGATGPGKAAPPGKANPGPTVAGKSAAEWFDLLQAIDPNQQELPESTAPLRDGGDTAVALLAGGLATYASSRRYAMARLRAFQILGGIRSPASARALAGALGAADTMGRVGALQGLQRLGPAAAPALPILLRLCEQGRLKANDLHFVRGMGPEALPELIAALKQAPPQVARVLASSVGALAKEASPELRERARAALLATLPRLPPEASGSVLLYSIAPLGEVEAQVLVELTESGPVSHELLHLVTRQLPRAEQTRLLPAMVRHYLAEPPLSEQVRRSVLAAIQRTPGPLPAELGRRMAEDVRQGTRPLQQAHRLIARAEGGPPLLLELIESAGAELAPLDGDALPAPAGSGLERDIGFALGELGRRAPRLFRRTLAHPHLRLRWLAARSVTVGNYPEPSALVDPLCALLDHEQLALRHQAANSLFVLTRSLGKAQAPALEAARARLQARQPEEPDARVQTWIREALRAIERSLKTPSPTPTPRPDAPSPERAPRVPLLEASVVDEAGERLESVSWELEPCRSPGERMRRYAFNSAFFLKAPRGDASFGLASSTRVGPHALRAWTTRGLFWREVDLIPGQTARVEFVARAPGSVSVRYRAPSKRKNTSMGLPTQWEISLVAGGWPCGVADLEVPDGETGTTTIAAAQPGTYTVVARGQFGALGIGRTWVKAGVEVVSGETHSLTIPELPREGGLQFEFVTGPRKSPVNGVNACVFLPDQDYALALVRRSVDHYTPGTYRLVAEVPGYERLERSIQLKRAKTKKGERELRKLRVRLKPE